MQKSFFFFSWTSIQSFRIQLQKRIANILRIKYETFQSAYKNFPFLVRVQNDILCAIDNSESVILLLLDLSAAFDTVDHSMLLSRLRERLEVNGTAAAWFESYLTSRMQFVRVNDCRSTRRSLERGVP